MIGLCVNYLKTYLLDTKASAKLSRAYRPPIMKLTELGAVYSLITFLLSNIHTDSSVSAQQTQGLSQTITTDTSEPYMVTLRFTRASDTRHNYYRVGIVGKSKCPAEPECHAYLDIAKYASNGTEIHGLRIEKVKPGESSVVNISIGPVIPGSYKIKVDPYGDDPNCFFDCGDEILDSDIFYSDSFSIIGSDYLPPIQLVLTLAHQTDELNLQIPIAPRSYFITDYIVTITGNNTESPNITETYHEAAGNHWSVANKSIARISRFMSGEKLYGKIVPIISETLCNEDGMYNYNGSCRPFTPALSNTVIIKSHGGIPNPAAVVEHSSSPDLIIIVSGAVGGGLLLCIIIAIAVTRRVVLKRRRRAESFETQQIQQQSQQNLLTDNVTILSEETVAGSEAIYFGENNKSLCIVYIDQSPQYDKLLRTLQKVFESYFEFNHVVLYGGEGEWPLFAQFTCVLVLDSVDLFLACQDFVYDDSISACSMLQASEQITERRCPTARSRVANIVNILKSEFVQNVAMASFNHLPNYHHSKISTSSGKGTMEIYKLPGDIKCLMLKEVYSVSQGQSGYITSWEGYIHSPERRELEEAIRNLTAPQTSDATEDDNHSLNNLDIPDRIHENEESPEYTSIGTDAGSLACSVIDSAYATGEGLSGTNTPPL